uniref:SJCHGC03748 protein n=1 Tax=Schistosoma japonicum TaxID=6182 RepID=Q5BSN0_SCHJA|nr:SJCHGC03748 protein [Schistosoma japonicum]
MLSNDPKYMIHLSHLRHGHQALKPLPWEFVNPPPNGKYQSCILIHSRRLFLCPALQYSPYRLHQSLL